jgi:small ligand-binding sensory domain FIST
MDSEKVDGFVAWTPFKHPSLGDVEIGGFKPYVTVNPPASKIAELGAAHAKFAVHLTSLFARVGIAKTEVTALGGGLYRVKAEVENTGFLPTALAQGVTARAVKPVMVQLGVPPESIVTGSEKTNSIPTLAGSGSRQSYEWVITAKPGSTVTLKVVSQKGGADTATLTLK